MTIKIKNHKTILNLVSSESLITVCGVWASVGYMSMAYTNILLGTEMERPYSVKRNIRLLHWDSFRVIHKEFKNLREQ